MGSIGIRGTTNPVATTAAIFLAVIAAACSDSAGDDDGDTCGSGQIDVGELCLTGQTPTALTATAATVVDVDGDGAPDVVAVDFASGMLTVLGNDGQGGLSAGSPVAVGAGAVDVAAGDLDGDGDADLVVSLDGDDALAILDNDGAGTVALLPLVPVNPGPAGLALGDFAAGGTTEVAVAQRRASSLGILVFAIGGFQIGGFQVIDVTPAPEALAAADLDGDGDHDLVATTLESEVPVLLRGASTFAAAPSLATDEAAAGLALADLDGDVDPCLILAFAASDRIGIAVNQGGGAFAVELATFDSGTAGTTDGPVHVAVADLDGDGQNDLVAANRSSQTVGIGLARPEGFAMTTTAVTAGAPIATLLADFNRDGARDIGVLGIGGFQVLLSAP
jgi:hypothetical protein